MSEPTGTEAGGDDDLGDFFTEIEQIEKTVPGEEGREEKEELKIAAPIEIVSKPQMNSRSHSIIHTGYGGTYSTTSIVKVTFISLLSLLICFLVPLLLCH
jgi:hypothetical protein